MNLPSKIMDHARANGGVVTTDSALRAVSRYITATQAARARERGIKAGHHARIKDKPVTKQIPVGKRRVVSDALIKLFNAGKLIRVSKGTYKIKEQP